MFECVCRTETRNQMSVYFINWRGATDDLFKCTKAHIGNITPIKYKP